MIRTANEESTVEGDYERSDTISVTEVEGLRRMGQAIEDGVTEMLREVQGQEQVSQIRESRYNKKYKKIATPLLPQYLQKMWKRG